MSSSDKKSAAFLAISVVWLFYLYTYIARIEPSVLVNDLMSEFNITAATIGMVISVMYIPYVILQIPCGIITDKLGVKTVITASSLLCALGTFVFGSATGVLGLQLGRFLIGIASASAFICCGKVAADLFDKRKYSLLMGIAMCMGCLGGIFGTSPTAFLVSKIGWRWTTFCISIVGIALSLMAVFFIKTKKKKEEKSAQQRSGLLEGVKIMASNPKMWILGLYGAITYLPLSAIAELWGVPLMELRFSVKTEAAAFTSIVIFIGFGLGGVLSAWIAERINSYKKTIIFFTFGIILTFYTALYSDSISFMTCIILLFFGGIFAGANTLAFSIAFHMVPLKHSATSAGFTNALIMTSGIIFQPLLGKLLDFFRKGAVSSLGEPIYNIGMYRSAFMVVMVAMAFAIFLAFFINDVKHKKEEN